MPPRRVANNLIKFAIPFAIKPNVIRAIGPIPAIIAVTTVITFLVPSLKLLNFSKTLPKN